MRRGVEKCSLNVLCVLGRRALGIDCLPETLGNIWGCVIASANDQ